MDASEVEEIKWRAHTRQHVVFLPKVEDATSKGNERPNCKQKNRKKRFVGLWGLHLQPQSRGPNRSTWDAHHGSTVVLQHCTQPGLPTLPHYTLFIFSLQDGALFRSSRGSGGARIVLMHRLCRASGASPRLDHSEHVAEGASRALIFAHQQGHGDRQQGMSTFR